MATDERAPDTGTADDRGTAAARDPRARNRGPAARRRQQTTSRLAFVGMFVVMAGLLFALGLFMIGDRRALFARDFEIYTEFSRLGGIQKGAIVRVAGADAGEVAEIRVPRNPSEQFRLKLRVLEDLRGLVRTDSVASIQTDGLVGNKFIQIEAGTDAAPQAPDGSTIQGSDLYDFSDLLSQAGTTLQALNDVIGQIQTSINTALSGVTDTMAEANRIMVGLERELQTILGKGEVIVQDLGLIVKDVRSGKGTAGKLVNDTELYDRANKLLAEADGVISKVNDAADQAKQLVSELRTNTGPVQGAIADLRQTLSSAREAMADLSESSEALKRNFFFRGFFERRGYYDLDDIPIDEYRAGALESRDRRVVRVWLRSDVLFAGNEQGQEVLTDEGRTRLESAMSDFLKHPPDSPIVIEGYAVAPTHDERYILSRRRASAAREYLVSRIQLDMTRIGIMPLGDQAPGSPASGTWDGIAIAIFLKTDR
ncbi:MAG TPA: MlaD family protein [Vicinamibacterales bacterium]|nr:MlaD family protein [Vicinamibacterales bacterium]